MGDRCLFVPLRLRYRNLLGEATKHQRLRARVNRPLPPWSILGGRSVKPFYRSSCFLISFLAGLTSGLISHMASAKILYPMMVRRLSTTVMAAPTVKPAEMIAQQTSRKTTILPSLGISGAVYGAVTLTTLAFPDTEVSLMIPPTYPIPIQYGVGALVTMDIIGVLRGWR
jgi:membrane associated rhomboid family serine protease